MLNRALEFESEHINPTEALDELYGVVDVRPI